MIKISINKKTSKILSHKLDRILAIFALIIIIIACYVGSYQTEADLYLASSKLLPNADYFESIGDETFTAWKKQPATQLLAYITVGSSSGYGGKLKTIVAVDSVGQVLGFRIIEQRESLPFYRRVFNSGLLTSLTGKSYSDPFELNNDVETVSGATFTCRAITATVKTASRKIAVENLYLSPPSEKSPSIQFGFLELILLFLFFIGLIGRQRRFKYKKIVRWTSMITGLVVLGFVYNRQLTIIDINKLLLGFLPEWQSLLSWYILVLGILLFIIFRNSNPYCEWFCPFGSAQECFGIIGGVKDRYSKKFNHILRWIPRVLALVAIILALLFRNPGISSFEVFGTFFKLIGSNYQFFLLGLVLVTALFIKRPWCSYLCPLRPVTDLIKLFRNWGIEIWENIKIKRVG
jgi:NosR/NirI family transcriptional regulator, nitrous oxide reductase regulator